MTQGKHTPGRLKRTKNSYGELHIDGLYIARVKSTLADTDRLAAAWNACEGIPTEALEAGVVKDMLEVLEEVLSDLQIGAHPYLHIGQIRDVIARAIGDPQ